MGKRRGEEAGIEMDVRREVYEAGGEDDDDSGSNMGMMNRASADVSSGRVIRKAKRTIVAKKGPLGPKKTIEEEAPKKGLFAGINLMAGGSSTSSSSSSSSSGFFSGESAAKKSNPFGSVNLSSNGGFGSNDNNVLGSLSYASTTTTTTAAAAKGDDGDDQHLKHVAAMNNSFYKWVTGKFSQDKKASLVSGVREYIKYAQELNETTQPTTSTMSSAGPSSSSSSSSFLKPASSSSFGMSSSGSSSGGGSTLFGGDPVKPFSFGAPTSSSLSFFSAPAAGAAMNGNGDSKQDDEDEGTGDDDEPPAEVEQNIPEGQKLLHKERAKIVCLRGSEWSSKGTGDLSLLQEKESKRSFLVLRVASGRVTCTIPLYAGLKPTVDAKTKSVKFAAVSYTEDKDGNQVAENDGKPAPFVIRVKAADLAEKLAKEISGAVAQI